VGHADRHPQFVVLNANTVVGWCDVIPNHTRMVYDHCGTLGVGLLPQFRGKGIGRKLDRKFCARCGSAVFVEAEGFPGMALIMGGTLDDTSWLKPTMALFCDST